MMVDKNQNNYCVIMAGGVGSRFWPFSRESKPTDDGGPFSSVSADRERVHCDECGV